MLLFKLKSCTFFSKELVIERIYLNSSYRIFNLILETTTRLSCQSKPTPSQFQAQQVAKMTQARRPSYSSLWSAMLISKTTWKSSTRFARRMKKPQARSRRILEDKKPTEILEWSTPLDVVHLPKTVRSRAKLCQASEILKWDNLQSFDSDSKGGYHLQANNSSATIKSNIERTVATQIVCLRHSDYTERAVATL